MILHKCFSLQNIRVRENLKFKAWVGKNEEVYTDVNDGVFIPPTRKNPRNFFRGLGFREFKALIHRELATQQNSQAKARAVLQMSIDAFLLKASECEKT